MDSSQRHIEVNTKTVAKQNSKLRILKYIWHKRRIIEIPVELFIEMRIDFFNVQNFIIFHLLLCVGFLMILNDIK